MCASFMIKQRKGIWQDYVNAVKTDIEEFYDQLIVPYQMAPVIVQNGHVIEMRPMKFSLIPSWSKDPKPKFATHNARIETLADKPTWRDAFQRRHCLIPLTDFIEPIYKNEYAGHMVAFHQKSGEPLMAAGIWEEWTNKITGEVTESFSIITADPPQFIADVGHDRCPLFLNESSQKQWLTLRESPPKMLDFLRASRLKGDFAVEKHRPMKPGWEKRIKPGPTTP